MRVISGTYGGRLLQTPKQHDDFRPTTDRVRESLFNILEHSYGIDGTNVCDLFAGTGSLGIEALSRGAGSAVFVEQSRNHAAILSNNLKSLGIKAVASLRISAVEKFLAARVQAFDIIFCDPPYRYEGIEKLLHLLAEGPALTPGGILVYEHSGKTEISPPEPWHVDQVRNYGTTAITIMELQA